MTYDEEDKRHNMGFDGSKSGNAGNGKGGYISKNSGKSSHGSKRGNAGRARGSKSGNQRGKSSGHVSLWLPAIGFGVPISGVAAVYGASVLIERLMA